MFIVIQNRLKWHNMSFNIVYISLTRWCVSINRIRHVKYFMYKHKRDVPERVGNLRNLKDDLKTTLFYNIQFLPYRLPTEILIPQDVILYALQADTGRVRSL